MSETGRRTFSAQSTTEDVLTGIDLSGRVAIVTGASGGLGEETARALASRGCAVTLAARDAGKAEKAALRVRERCPSARVDVGLLELSQPASVDTFARRWLASHGPLHLLILNAGIMACPLARTAEGWEMQFATNHLGHFLLTARLIERLRESAPARVIALSSGGHVISAVVFDDIHYERRDYEPWSSYGQSKTANVLFAAELDRRERAAGVRAHSVHPGMIHTDLGRHLTPEAIRAIIERATEGGAEVPKTVEQGAATSVWAATAPELEGQGGLYLADCGIPAAPEEGGKGAAAHARDAAAAARLWAVSEETLGVSFP
jgi:NAD(P)-dependent dehydrogenase (short-subunit alcohol dehydrogenase family)